MGDACSSRVTMDDLFRFISVRPPKDVDKVKTVSISGSTPFQEKARKAIGSPKDICRLAKEFVQDGVTPLTMHQQFTTLRSRLKTSCIPWNLDSIEAEIKDIFGNSPSRLETDSKKYLDDRAQIWDSIILTFLLPGLHSGSLSLLLKFSQIINIIHRVAVHDHKLDGAMAVQDALDATIVLPSDLFPSMPAHLHSFGIADLLVVKTHIQRYELGEIVQIKNIVGRREIGNTPETTDQQTSVPFLLKRETENIITEDSEVGLRATRKYGHILRTIPNVNIAYSNAITDSQNVSSDYAKDLVRHATSNITQRIREQETTRILENFQNDNDVSGVYQRVNKVYEAQVFNYGKRLLFSITVPEPAALLQKQLPQGPPQDFTLSPADLGVCAGDNNYYGKYLAQYEVEGVHPPPFDKITVAKTLTRVWDDKEIAKGAEVPIPDGYQAVSVHVDGMYNYSSADNNGLQVWVGDQHFQWINQQSKKGTDANFNHRSAKFISIVTHGWNITDYGIVVQIVCEPSGTIWEQWRLDTHSKILSASLKKSRDYQNTLSALKCSHGSLGSSDTPDRNRRIERTEIKRAAISILLGKDLPGINTIDQDSVPPPLPQTPPPSQRSPRPSHARFFEQAFEWEHMTYILYPSCDARKNVLYDTSTQTNADPLFTEFLHAGEASVDIPVRPLWEQALSYFSMTGLVWEGNDVPSVVDARYLPFAEEMKEGAGRDEVPFGPSWDIVVPTLFIEARKNCITSGKLEPPWTPKLDPEA